MKSIRLIRLALALVLLMLVVIVIVQFNRPEPETSEPSDIGTLTSGNTGTGATISGGNQVFYRDGKAVATLSFERAVTQDASGTLVEDVRLKLEERNLTITAPLARIKDPVVELMGEVSLESDSGNRLRLTPPVHYEAPMLTGSGRAEVRAGNALLTGTGFRINTDQEWIRLNHGVHLIMTDADLEMNSNRGLYRFSADQMVMVDAVQFSLSGQADRESRVRGTADMALVNPASGAMQLTGRGKARWGAGYLYFTRLSIRTVSDTTQIESSAPVLVSTSPESWLAYLPEFRGSKEQILSPWSMVQMNNGFFSMAACVIHPQTGVVTGENPYGQVNTQQVRGSRVRIADNGIALEQPVLTSPDGTQLKGTALLKRHAKALIELDGPVYGAGRNGLMTADRGWYQGTDWHFADSVWWTDRANSWVYGDELVLEKGSLDHVRIVGNVDTTFTPEPGMTPVQMSSRRAELNEDILRVSGDVIARQGEIVIHSDRGYVTGKQGIFMPSSISIGSNTHAEGNLLILPVYNTWGWLFGNVNLQDSEGNRATGHKLTFERTTGRISMYKGKHKVQISLTL